MANRAIQGKAPLMDPKRGSLGENSWLPKNTEISERTMAVMIKYWVLIASEVLINVTTATRNKIMEPAMRMVKRLTSNPKYERNVSAKPIR